MSSTRPDEPTFNQWPIKVSRGVSESEQNLWQEDTTVEAHGIVLVNGKWILIWVLNIDHRDYINWTCHQNKLSCSLHNDNESLGLKQ